MKQIITLKGDKIEWFDSLPFDVDIYNLTTKRASHIVPLNPIKRAAFVVLRFMFGERGRVAEWTRSWHGPWRVTIIGSQRQFVHASRRVCIEWERQVLNEA